MNASIREGIRVYCESCKQEKRRFSCFGCIFDKRHDDLGEAAIAVGVEMDAIRSCRERLVDAARRTELLAELVWRRVVGA